MAAIMSEITAVRTSTRTRNCRGMPVKAQQGERLVGFVYWAIYRKGLGIRQ
jgi:hypothetical protein